MMNAMMENDRALDHRPKFEEFFYRKYHLWKDMKERWS